MSDFLTAEAGIRQLHSRYTDAVWRKDYAAFGDCFTEDAEWRITGLVLKGRGQIVDTFRQFMGRFSRVLVTLRTPILEVEGDLVTGRTYLSEQSVFSDGSPYAVIGIYYEHFVNQSDRWRFSWRLFQTHYSGSPNMTGNVFDNPDYGPPPAMPPLDAPTINHSNVSVGRGAK